MLLGWKGKDLADKSGVGITTLRRYEAQDGIHNANKFVLKAIKSCLEDAGVAFSGDPLTDPGVKLRKSD